MEFSPGIQSRPGPGQAGPADTPGPAQTSDVEAQMWRNVLVLPPKRVLNQIHVVGSDKTNLSSDS